jgi:hypothetical protein
MLFRCHHRLTTGTNTVTESVVLPPLIGGDNAPIKAASPGYSISGIIDWCNRDQSPTLVISRVVHLAGLH